MTRMSIKLLIKEVDDGRATVFRTITTNYPFVKNLADDRCHFDVSVLIIGETGTGKELIAQAIHKESRRRQNELVTINCAALPIEGIEDDLFGRCDDDGNISHRGRLLAAEGGTLFLDNIEALPLSIQAKVLRFIEAGECQLIGSHKLQKVDVRIVAASGADIQHEVDAGRFRSDLFYRLQVVPITIPPLRERADDIVLLLRHFGREFSGNNAVVRYGKEVERCLLGYPWPGNVRELMHFIFAKEWLYLTLAKQYRWKICRQK